MDTTPLPTQEDDISDNGLPPDNYVLRVTPCQKFTLAQFRDFLEGEFQIMRYVVAVESVPQEHYHVVLSVDSSVDQQNVRDIIKHFLIPFWQTPEFKLPRGFGNKQYNLQPCEDIDLAISYALKSKCEYFFSGFEQEYLDARIAASYAKKKFSDFKSEFRDLNIKFQEDESMELRTYMIAMALLKSKYEQQVVMSHIYAYALSALLRRDPTEAENFVENYLYKQ